MKIKDLKKYHVGQEREKGERRIQKKKKKKHPIPNHLSKNQFSPKDLISHEPTESLQKGTKHTHRTFSKWITIFPWRLNLRTRIVSLCALCTSRQRRILNSRRRREGKKPRNEREKEEGGRGTIHRKFALHSTSAGGVTNGCERSTCEFPRLVPIVHGVYIPGWLYTTGWLDLVSLRLSRVWISGRPLSALLSRSLVKEASKKEGRTRAAGYHCPGQSLPR